MNKTLYKVIFNKKRGCMMAVAENTKREGKSVADTQDTKYSVTPISASFVQSLSILSFSVFMILGTASISFADDILVDPTAPKTQQATILQTGNGTPQINIQTPTSAGVSVNQYQQFDVNGKGAILNNSRGNVQTQLGGWIQGNPWLARGEARVIVNQINSSHPSQLNGYIEVGGKRAEVVMANPAGIAVNGGGFINASRATLTTGTPQYQAGALTGFHVRSGEVAIHGQGLDTRDTDYTRILSYHTKVNAPIWGKDVRVVAGQNDVAATGDEHTVVSHAPTGLASQTSPVFAIDTSALGGMYANKITLISTAQQAGIRNQGQLFATAGNVAIDANGRLINSGTIAATNAQDANNSEEHKVNIRSQAIENSGTIASQQRTQIQSQSIQNTGTVLSSGELDIHNAGSLKNETSGHIQAARLAVQTDTLDNQGNMAQTGAQKLHIQANGQLSNSGKIGLPAETPNNTGHTTSSQPNTPSSATGAGSTHVQTSANTGGTTHAANPTAPVQLADGSIQTQDTLNNSGGIHANGAVDLTAKNSLSNTAELNVNQLAVSGDVLNNANAKISVHSTDIQTQSIDNQQGQFIASQTLNMTTHQLDNREGKLQSVDSVHLTVSGSLNNQKGEIAANNALNIQDKKTQTLHIDNTDGTIVADNVSLQSKSLNNKGILTAGNALSIDLKDGFIVERDLAAGNKLSIQTAGSLKNTQTIQAESEVNIQAKQNISNRGTINSNGLTRVEASQELLNIGTGKIYGNHVALSADSVVNRDENEKAAVVAARERLDIGARKIINQTEQETPLNSDAHSKFLSEGTLFIGRHLDNNHHATGQANSLDNLSANIESAGDMSISAAQTTNKNLHIRTAIEKVGTEHKNTISFSNRSSSKHGPGDWGWDLKSKLPDEYERDQFRFNGINNIYLKQDDGSEVHLGRIWIENNYTLDNYETLVKYTAPSVIQSGGNLSFNGNVSNVNSSIIANKNIITQNGHLIQDGVQGTRYVIKNGTKVNRDWYHDGGLFGSGYTRQDMTTSFNNEKLNEQTFALPTTRTLSNQALQNRGAVAQTANAHITAANVSFPSHQNASLPNSSLYTINPNHPNWLVETDPAFTNYRQWLGSDYMLHALKTDPNNMHKRLGDGYYEQRMISEQIAQLTGRPYFAGHKNREEQYKALMNAGIQFAQQFNINIGTALSSEQMSRLTVPIVWLELQTVTLANGSQEQVYVPKVYLANNQTALKADGSLISAHNIMVNGQGHILNKGTLHANHELMIAADNIQHQSGRIEGQKIYLDAKQDIVNQADIYAKDHLTARAGRDIVLASTTSSNSHQMPQGAAFMHSNIAQNAQIRVGNGVQDAQQASLSLQAGRDVTLQAATLENTGRGANLIQAGRDLSIGSIETVSNQKTVWDADNQQHQIKTTQNGSNIQTQGHILLQANQKLDVSASTINSEHGKVQLVGQDVSIAHAHEQEDYSDKFYSKNDGFLSSSSARSQSEYQRSTAVGSNITGKHVAVQAHNNLSASGSQIISDDGTQLKAGNHVQITTAENTFNENSHHQTKKSGLMSAGIGFTIGSKTNTQAHQSQSTEHTGSTVGSLKGDTTIVAGKQYTQIGSTVSSPEGNNTIHAQSMDIQAAHNQLNSNTTQTHEQKGLTVAFSSPITDLAQQAIGVAQSSKQVGQSKNGRVNAMAAANAGWQAYQTFKSAQNIANDPQKAVKQVSIAITYGQQKNQRTTQIQTSQAQASQTQSGGKTTLIATGAAEQSNITITGSDVAGKTGTSLIADNNITLQSAEQNSSERSKDQSTGWHAGVAVSLGQGGWSLGFIAGGNVGKGHGNGDSITHRHSHIGDKNSSTLIQSGGDTTLKGAQVIGKDIQVHAQNLHIQSVQDSETYQSKQQNASAQITVGYGFSASGDYSQSKINANHQSVSKQSGLYAGDEGYQINIAQHTDLKGGIITSTQSAEDTGKNQFSTGTLTHSDIQNHSQYKGNSFGLGASVAVSGKTLGLGEQNNPQESHLKTVADKNAVGSSMGYGNDSDGQSSITKSGINTQNTQITDEAKQIQLTGKTAEQSKAQIHTDTTTDTAQTHSGHLKNVFDKEAVQSELDLQVQVTKEFGTVAPNLVATASEKLGNVSEYETVVLIKADAERALAQTSDETERTKLVQIIQQADEYLATNKTAYETWKEGGIGRALLQSGVGGLMTGNANGALAGGTTSLAAPYLNAAEEKLGAAGGGILNAVSGAAIGYAVGGNVGSAAVGANVDWHNRQLHPDETNILNRLSQGQSSEAQYRLKAAACALTRCSEGVPTFDPAYQGLQQLQQAGTQFNQEQRQLLAAGGFRYSNFDRLNDGRSRYDRSISKITGAFNIGTGTSMAVGSARLAIGLCATSGGAACIAGGALGVLGVETGRNQIQQGGQQLFGTYRSDFGRRVLHSLGRPIEYEAPLVSDAKNLAMWGLESLLARKLNGVPNTHQPPRTAHPAQSRPQKRPPEASSDAILVGPRGGIAHNTSHIDSNGRTIYRRESGGYYVLDSETGKQINVRSPFPQAVSSTGKQVAISNPNAKPPVASTSDLHRPHLRIGTQNTVYGDYIKLPNGNYVLKTNTDIVVQGPVHIAHRYGWENHRLLRVAKELGMTQKQLNEYVNDPRRTKQLFELQNAQDNMGHRFEKPGIDDLDRIKRDMRNFLNGK